MFTATSSIPTFTTISGRCTPSARMAANGSTTKSIITPGMDLIRTTTPTTCASKATTFITTASLAAVITGSLPQDVAITWSFATTTPGPTPATASCCTATPATNVKKKKKTQQRKKDHLVLLLCSYLVW